MNPGQHPPNEGDQASVHTGRQSLNGRGRYTNNRGGHKCPAVLKRLNGRLTAADGAILANQSLNAEVTGEDAVARAWDG